MELQLATIRPELEEQIPARVRGTGHGLLVGGILSEVRSDPDGTLRVLLQNCPAENGGPSTTGRAPQCGRED